MPCATHTSRMGWRAYKTFQPAVSPVARHCYLFGGLYGQVGWSLRHNNMSCDYPEVSVRSSIGLRDSLSDYTTCGRVRGIVRACWKVTL